MPDPHTHADSHTPRSQRPRRILAFSGVGLVILAALKALTGCQLATPFRGDGYSSRRGVTLDGVGDTVTVGLTNATLDGSRRRAFDDYTQRVVASLPGTPGYIGHSIRTRVLGNEVWTMTVWKDEASLDAFVRSPTHREAIRLGMPAVASAKFHRYTIPVGEVPPSWSDVMAVLEKVEARQYGPTSPDSGSGEARAARQERP